jgi:hypothetical protein
MQADYTLLGQQLDTARTLAAQQSQHSTKDYTDAKDRAEHEAEEAAGRLVRGLRAVLLDHPNPALAQAARYAPSTLNRLRGEALLGAIDSIAAAADGAASQLAAHDVTAAHRQRLGNALAAFRPLVGTPRTQIVAGAATTATLRKLVKELRTTFPASIPASITYATTCPR